MPAGVNKANVRAFFDTINREKSMRSLPRYVTDGYSAHFPEAEMDSKGMIEYGDSYFAAFSNLSFAYEDVFAEGDMVGLCLIMKGTHSQPLQGAGGSIPASGKNVTVIALNLFKMTEDAKIAEHWSSFDTLGFLKDIGAIPR